MEEKKNSKDVHNLKFFKNVKKIHHFFRNELKRQNKFVLLINLQCFFL